jgi:hypothetical protein
MKYFPVKKSAPINPSAIRNEPEDCTPSGAVMVIIPPITAAMTQYNACNAAFFSFLFSFVTDNLTINIINNTIKKPVKTCKPKKIPSIGILTKISGNHELIFDIPQQLV